MMNILNLISNNFPCVFQASVRKGKAGRERALYMYIYTVCAAGCVPAKMEFAHLQYTDVFFTHKYHRVNQIKEGKENVVISLYFVCGEGLATLSNMV